MHFQIGHFGYKFLHSGNPSDFGSLLSIHCGRYGTRYNRPNKRLQAPHLCPSVHKSKEYFGHNFDSYAPTVCNDLHDNICSAPTLAGFRKKLKSILFKKAFPSYHRNNLAFLWYRSGYVCGIRIIGLCVEP